jgi:hypothetical protein
LSVEQFAHSDRRVNDIFLEPQKQRALGGSDAGGEASGKHQWVVDVDVAEKFANHVPFRKMDAILLKYNKIKTLEKIRK